jgi:hypothetical protein
MAYLAYPPQPPKPAIATHLAVWRAVLSITVVLGMVAAAMGLFSLA